MNTLVDDFISCKRIAVVGMSRNKGKFGNLVVRELSQKGYEVMPVHPVASQIDGYACYPDLHSLEGPVQGLFISVPAAQVSSILEDAARLNIRNIWLQQGAWSGEVEQTVNRLQLQVVSNKCLLMYLPPVRGIHRFHRAICRFIGKL